MSHSKQALWLAWFEIKKSIGKVILLMIFMFLPFTAFLITSLHDYLEKNIVMFDYIFLLAFALAAAWVRPKGFQLDKLTDGMYGSPFFVFLNQLPIQKDVLVKSRFIVYFVYSVPFQLLLLVLLYSFSPELRAFMPWYSYLVFSIIWLSFNAYWGLVYPVADAGEKATTTTVAFSSILLVIVGMFVPLIIAVYTNYGIVGWTMFAAKRWPIISSALSIIAALYGLSYWKHSMKKKIDRNDYFN
ncbi:hypothetical protein [Peribacillus huizhouensis]|uniref:ABC-2 type transport system permease protein n=1 Tax=Peribacillus huizhouensis TaxID=1501239 RepID=A0ABR6CQC6_9BACI|nr:hypothetical protein [Peribacillus huizhouensis]MBA9026775.1 hypothetical protein [Peribacillus huizhouensis]